MTGDSFLMINHRDKAIERKQSAHRGKLILMQGRFWYIIVMVCLNRSLIPMGREGGFYSFTCSYVFYLSSRRLEEEGVGKSAPCEINLVIFQISRCSTSKFFSSPASLSQPLIFSSEPVRINFLSCSINTHNKKFLIMISPEVLDTCLHSCQAFS